MGREGERRGGGGEQGAAQEERARQQCQEHPRGCCAMSHVKPPACCYIKNIAEAIVPYKETRCSCESDRRRILRAVGSQ
jgi:hypothetical protein